MFRWIAGGSILVALSPLLGLLTATALASAIGRQVDETSARPCATWMGDVADLLYSLQVGGWQMLPTLPYAVGMSLAWAIVEVVPAAPSKGKGAA